MVQVRGREFYRCIHKLRTRYHIEAAQSSIKNSKPSGGVLVLADKRLQPVHWRTDVSSVGHSREDNWAMMLLRIKRCNVAFVSVYLHPEGDREGENLATLFKVNKALGLLGCPYLLCGDFNRAPEKLRELEWPPMCIGNLLTSPNIGVTCFQGG